MATDFTKPIGAETADQRLARMQAEQAQRQVDRQNARAGTALQGTYIAPESSQQYVADKAAGKNPTSPAYATGLVNKELVYAISDGGAQATATKPVDHLYPIGGAGTAPGTTPGAGSGGGSTAPGGGGGTAPGVGSGSAGGPPSTGSNGSSSSSSGQSGFNQWNVTPPQTVQQQTADIARQDSPLMQQARGRAMQQMNERGLINSSLAVQAAQDAVLDRAIQIGGADAATNANAAQFNANQGNAWNLAQQELEYKRWAVGQAFENEKQLREIENTYRDQLTSDEGFQQQYSMYIDRIFKIDMNTEIDDPAVKARMKQEAGQQLDDYVAINKLGINMDFSDYWKAQEPAKTEEKPKPGGIVNSGMYNNNSDGG